MEKRVFFDRALYISESRKVALAITGFIVLYLLLFALTLVVAACAAVLGGAIVYAKPHWATLAIFISLVMFGLFIIYFMVKFMFVKKDTTDAYRVEVTAGEEPALFALIARLAQQVDTDMPGKVFLSHRVNACVFYNSFSFWSMLFPVKKNLEIGLGLFNTLNVSELSSIIAHEFGHFSQKSMKFGPYIYHANRVIYNMLYENDAWETSVKNLAAKHWSMQIFAAFSMYYANFIKTIMVKVYELINVRYMSLSRQMEFHADSIAVEVCGTEAFRSAMLKVEWTDTGMNETLDMLNGVSAENLKSKNLFACQQQVIRELAVLNGVAYRDSTIEVEQRTESQDKYRARVRIEDQWASHPLMAERLENAEALHTERNVDAASCWTLLHSDLRTQEQMTQHMYTTSQTKGTEELSAEDFVKRYRTKLEMYSYPKVYNGYYDNRTIEDIDLENVVAENAARDPFEELFKTITIPPGNKIAGLQNDMELLLAIEKENVKVKFFDFDGTKQEAHRSYVYRKQLEEELEVVMNEIKAQDKWVFDFCYSLNPAKAAELKQRYADIKQLKERYQEFEKLHAEAMQVAQSMYANREMTFVTSQSYIFKNTSLPPVIERLKELRQTGNLLNRYPLNPYSLKLDAFLKESYVYFDGAQLQTDQFIHFNFIGGETLQYLKHCIVTETRLVCLLQENIYHTRSQAVMTA